MSGEDAPGRGWWYARRAMLALIRDLDAFYLEHRRCGELDADVEGERLWMACECGARLVSDVGSPTEAGGGDG